MIFRDYFYAMESHEMCSVCGFIRKLAVKRSSLNIFKYTIFNICECMCMRISAGLVQCRVLPAEGLEVKGWGCAFKWFSVRSQGAECWFQGNCVLNGKGQRAEDIGHRSEVKCSTLHWQLNLRRLRVEKGPAIFW